MVDDDFCSVDVFFAMIWSAGLKSTPRGKTYMASNQLALATVATAALSLTATVQAGGDRERNPESEVVINKEIHVVHNRELTSDIRVTGLVVTDSQSKAVSEVNQNATGNEVYNGSETANAASAGDDILSGASGNIGLNVAAGDNNIQQNSIALATTAQPQDTTAQDDSYAGTATVDAMLVFGGATNAETFLNQSATYNHTMSYGVTNHASLSGNVGLEAEGNIGINIAAGSGNVQANQIALAPADSELAIATTSSNQVVYGNRIRNMSVEGNAVNETGDAALANIAPKGSVSSGHPIYKAANNNASLTGSAFAGASGNIGINIAAGTNNLQGNSLTISDISASAATGQR